MKSSNIGGQAVMEGIMMRHKDQYAVAVRKPDHEIAVQVEPYRSVVRWKEAGKIPLVRGVISFIDSLVVGFRTLMYSASFFEEEEDPAEEKKNGVSRGKEELTEEEKKAKKEREEKLLMTVTMVLSVVIAIAVFMLLPYFLSELLSKVISAKWALSLFEAVVRVLLFLGYLVAISRMKDIQRTYEYHGAEHKCINCIEHGMELNTENVLKSSRFHKRCGTSFLFFVVIVSVVLLMMIQTENHFLRVLLRLVLVPVIAGISFELIRWAGRSENPVVNLLSKPGLALQRLTTREPDAEEVEVAIAAVEAVFDWRAFLQENFPEKRQEN